MALMIDHESELEALRARCFAQQADWPAFQQAYADWVLGRLTKRVWRFGTRFGDVGDRVLVHPSEARFYCERYRVDIEVQPGYLERVAP